MKKAIRNFPNQLKFKPIIKNKERLIKAERFIVSGMGGSHLAADLLKIWNPAFNLVIHHNYGLPELPDNLKNYLTDLLEIDVDLVMKKALKPNLGRRILREVVYV